MNVEVSAPFEASYGSGATGLVGVIQVAVLDNDGNVVIGPTANDITEEIVSGVPTGVYTWNCAAAPAVVGQYSVVWSQDGTWNPIFVSSPDELVVLATGDTGVPIPLPVGGGVPFGPAQGWATVEDVAACCNATVEAASEYQDAVDEASQLLFELSGRLWIGQSAKTVRPPCRDNCGCGQVLSRGHLVGGWWGSSSDQCNPSRVLLSGYPVREITQVKIDGDVLAATEYGLDNYRWAVRKNNGVWPACQNLSLNDTEDGTWSIAYTYGQNPPLAGQAAAVELACELFKFCTSGECALPAGTTRVIRQGVVVERLAFSAWGRQQGIWRTGLPRVDAFLNAYNKNGLSRRPTIWSPARHLQYARRALT